MRTIDFLACLHETLAPPTYLEIGVRRGRSMALARAPSIGIDPEFDLAREPGPHVTLFGETSDAYFERDRPLEPFGGQPASLALIDGMHLVEYALRDFINVEPLAHWTSVVVVDDIFPRHRAQAARQRRSASWAGDLFKIPAILDEHRPDLILLRVDTRPTGVLLAIGLDPADRVLAERYDEIATRAIVPDPQPVPAAVLRRHWALEPERVLGASLLPTLRQAREEDVDRSTGLERLRHAVGDELGRNVKDRINRVRAVLPRRRGRPRPLSRA